MAFKAVTPQLDHVVYPLLSFLALLMGTAGVAIVLKMVRGNDTMRHRLRKLIVASGMLAVVAAVAGPAAAASFLYGADGSNCSPCNLYTINPTTGTVLTTIGPIGTGVTGLAFDPITGVLYGATNRLATGLESLLTINASTGLGTVIGAFDSVDGNPLVDIAFDSFGSLYGWSRVGDLYSVNLATGAATQVGDAIGASGAEGGLAINGANQVFAVRSETVLQLIDKPTGALLSTLSLSAPAFQAMDFDENGTLFAIGGIKGGTKRLVTINPTTGAVTDIGGPLPPKIDALAFLKSASVPEPSSLLLLGAGFVMFAVWKSCVQRLRKTV